MPRAAIGDHLRLTLVTDGVGDPRRIEQIVHAAVLAGVTCVQLREPRWTARVLARCCERLLPVCEGVGTRLLVNDRVDVAATRFAHGAQIGHRSLPAPAARALLPADRLLGFSAHDEAELAAAADAGCDFALLSPVWATTSKPGAPFLGVARAAALTAAARLPVAWLGGVTAQEIAAIADLPAAARPAGVAVRSAIMGAADPAAAAAELLRALASVLPRPAGSGPVR